MLNLLAPEIKIVYDDLIFGPNERKQNYQTHPVQLNGYNLKKLFVVNDEYGKNICEIKGQSYKEIKNLIYNGTHDTIGFLNIDHKNRNASFNIHRVVEADLTIVAMQYNEYRDSYKLLASHHTYELLKVDNNGNLPEFRPDENNSYDNRAVYIGMPHNKYGFIAKNSNFAECSKKYRELLYTKEYKEGKIAAVVKSMNTTNSFKRKNESVTATGVFYIKHPLCTLKDALNSKSNSCYNIGWNSFSELDDSCIM